MKLRDLIRHPENNGCEYCVRAAITAFMSIAKQENQPPSRDIVK
jgi:hypothetical protein